MNPSRPPAKDQPSLLPYFVFLAVFMLMLPPTEWTSFDNCIFLGNIASPSFMCQ